MAYLGTKPANQVIDSTLIADGTVTTSDLADNSITTAKIAAGAVVEADIADGAVTTNKLANSGVTAGTYGSASEIPAVTVDAKGRVTSVTTNAFSSTPTTAQVLSATAGATAGAVGTYIFANSTVNLAFGSTIAGSSITPNGWVSTAVGANNTILCSAAGSAQSGTWRIMGNASGSNWRATLLLRIS